MTKLNIFLGVLSLAGIVTSIYLYIKNRSLKGSIQEDVKLNQKLIEFLKEQIDELKVGPQQKSSDTSKTTENIKANKTKSNENTNDGTELLYPFIREEWANSIYKHDPLWVNKVADTTLSMLKDDGFLKDYDIDYSQFPPKINKAAKPGKGKIYHKGKPFVPKFQDRKFLVYCKVVSLTNDGRVKLFIQDPRHEVWTEPFKLPIPPDKIYELANHMLIITGDIIDYKLYIKRVQKTKYKKEVG